MARVFTIALLSLLASGSTLRRTPPAPQAAAEENVLNFMIKNLAAGAVNRVGGVAMGQLLASYGVGDATPAALAELGRTLDLVLKNEVQIQARLEDLSTQIAFQNNDLKEFTLRHTIISPVLTQLKTHYDDKGSSAVSLGYYYSKAGENRLTPADSPGMDQFAQNVIGTWQFTQHFNSIHTAIVPGDGTQGFFDLWVQEFVIARKDPATLMTRYQKMEADFAWLLAQQLKCAHVVVEAYSRLGGKPGSGVPGDAAADFMTKTVEPTIDREVEAFLKAVEQIALVHANWTEAQPAGRFLIPEARQMLARADFFSELWRGHEVHGISVRVLASRDVEFPRQLLWGPDAAAAQYYPHAISAYPSTITTRGLYASWRGAASADFTVTNEWKTFRTVQDTCARFSPTDNCRETTTFVFGDQWGAPGSFTDPVTITAQKYDRNYNPDPAGPYTHGSVTLEKRASSPEIFMTTAGWVPKDYPMKVSCDCKPYNCVGRDYSYCDVSRTASRREVSVRVKGKGLWVDNEIAASRTVRYVGSRAASATFAAGYDLSTSFLTCNAELRRSSSAGNTQWSYQLFFRNDATLQTLLNFWRDEAYRSCTMRGMEAPKLSGQVTLTPGQAYTVAMYVRLRGDFPHMGGESEIQMRAMMSDFTGLTNFAFK